MQKPLSRPFDALVLSTLSNKVKKGGTNMIEILKLISYDIISHICLPDLPINLLTIRQSKRIIKCP